MACGCAKKPQSPAVEQFKSLVEQGAPQVGANEVIVRWLAPTMRNTYRYSQVQRARIYNQSWSLPFPMLKADAEGLYQDEIEYVAVAVGV